MERYRDIFDKLIKGLEVIYGTDRVSVVLYGSVAKNTDTDESDIDIAVLLIEDDKEKHEKMIDLNIDLELECGRVLSLLTIDRDEYNKWNMVSPFYKNVREQGVVLWKAA